MVLGRDSRPPVVAVIPIAAKRSLHKDLHQKAPAGKRGLERCWGTAGSGSGLQVQLLDHTLRE